MGWGKVEGGEDGPSWFKSKRDERHLGASERALLSLLNCSSSVSSTSNIDVIVLGHSWAR
jgi:hypothetical protein